jgi:hypothetical protein
MAHANIAHNKNMLHSIPRNVYCSRYYKKCHEEEYNTIAYTAQKTLNITSNGYTFRNRNK